ncbi:DNA polymerase V subunit UmuC [Enterobacterales bacterium]|nr:DNA polymerase V subunit UmuC [Enterobacterales bacterium]
MFALVDVNSFYASCETVFRPDLQGRPVIVLSNNDGCVIARNAEARRAEIQMGAPFFKMREAIQRHNVVVFSSNYALYADMSQRVMETLELLAPAVDVYSIDEAFLDITGIDNCPAWHDFGKQVQDKIWKENHLAVGVGIAPTKTLAKLANFAAKKWKGTGGVLDLSQNVRQRKLMNLIPVEEVWGVGRRITKHLDSLGIKTALQLADSPSSLIRKHFSVVLERTVRELRGESCLAFEESVPTKQQIICSRSFGERITDYQDMREAICNYAVRAAEKLRGEHQYCRYISAFVKTSPHDPNVPYYSNHAGMKLLTPTQDSRDILNAAVRCLEQIWQPGYRYQKGGVMLGDFFSQGVAQLNLFDDYQPKRNSEQLMATLDEIHKRGTGKVWFAGQGIQRGWAMKREMLSPAYTTRVDELMRARV